ncbi:MAG TPA: DUF1177 domain-containing protein [Thermoplasmata archaeon]|nr:DUF1177 domain-containing protein [Thermoplasmata archaeon]
MLKQVVEAYELLDSASVNGHRVAEVLEERGLENIEVKTVKGKKSSTDFVKILVPGKNGKSSGRDVPTLGIIGRLGGIGARPKVIGLVSDADGAITAIAIALKLADMKRSGDSLDGDAILTTHICPNAPTKDHKPVPFMGSPVDMSTMNKHEVDERMDAILSIDTTKGNRIINIKGFAITPTVKEGWILRVSEDLLTLMEVVSGRLPVVVPITTQDITPYGNEIYHLNSIVQPNVATKAPVVGVALTSELPIPGCASGASHVVDIEQAARFCVEVAKGFGKEKIKFYDEEEFKRLVELYGSMKHLQALRGKKRERTGIE